MSSNLKRYNRKSIRLKGYDYSSEGLYYLTICVHNRLCLLGNVVENQLKLNDAGKMIMKWYYEIENKYPDKKCHNMVIMPNHFHCIIENETYNIESSNTLDTHVGDADRDAHAGISLRGCPNNKKPYGMDNKKYNASIFDVMDWFKTMTTNEYIRNVKQLGWERFDQRLWQKRYWDHVVRNDADFSRIDKYIDENPDKWIIDKLNSTNDNSN